MVDDSIINAKFLEMNSKVFMELSQLVGVLVKDHTELFMKHFEIISEDVLSMNEQSRSTAQKHFLVSPQCTCVLAPH